MIRAMQKLAAPMQRRVRLMVGRCVLKLISDAAKMQTAQVSLLEDEVRDGVERMQNYGFTSVPLAGCEGVMVCVGGNRDHGIIVATDDRRYRIANLQGGEVAIYTDENGTGLGMRIVLKRDRIIDVFCDKLNITAETEINLKAPALKIAGVSGDCHITLTGDIDASQDVVAGSGDISLIHHKHGGVTTGSGQTGEPV
jgi:phage baseplate assembly protein V